MEVFAHVKYVRMSPRKVKLVCDMIRGKDVKTAAALMSQTSWMLWSTHSWKHIVVMLIQLVSGHAMMRVSVAQKVCFLITVVFIIQI